MRKDKKISIFNREDDLLNVLLDEDNCDPVMMINPLGQVISFEQIAVIPHTVNDKNFLYAILRPLDNIEGVADDEAIVFRVDFDEAGNTELRFKHDDDISFDVFDKYYDLLESELWQKNNRKGGKND